MKTTTHETTNFDKEYIQFKAKISNFIVSTGFISNKEQYTNVFNQMASIAPDDMKEVIQKEPEFIIIRNKTLQIMENIVVLHNELDDIFKLEKEDLQKKYHDNLKTLDMEIAKKIKEVANLVYVYDVLSEKGRALVEKTSSPFFSQAN